MDDVEVTREAADDDSIVAEVDSFAESITDMAERLGILPEDLASRILNELGARNELS